MEEPAWQELFLHDVANQRCTILPSSTVRCEFFVSAMDANYRSASYRAVALATRNGSNNTVLKYENVTTEYEDIEGWDFRITVNNTYEALVPWFLGNATYTDNYLVKVSVVGIITEVRL
jgi:hypothetical protein